MVQKGPAERSLTGTNFARHNQDAFSLVNAVNEMGEGFFMMPAGKKEIRICGHVKRVFSEMIKLLIHEKNYSMIYDFGLAR